MTNLQKKQLTQHYEKGYKNSGVKRFKLFAKLDCLDFSLNFDKIAELIENSKKIAKV